MTNTTSTGLSARMALVVLAATTAMALAGCKTDSTKTAGTVAGGIPTKPQSNGNHAPSISGSPARSVTLGQTYSFKPTAKDADGDAITFKIANKPDWAAFDAATGRLSGQPADADAGTYTGIVISATDGKATASLAAFAITVNQIANGSATVTWNPPTENTDGTPLTDLAGYRIRYGQAPNQLTNVVTITNVGLTSAVIENLGPGTWYFGVVAFNDEQVESAVSELGQKTI